MIESHLNISDCNCTLRETNDGERLSEGSDVSDWPMLLHPSQLLA